MRLGSAVDVNMASSMINNSDGIGTNKSGHRTCTTLKQYNTQMGSTISRNRTAVQTAQRGRSGGKYVNYSNTINHTISTSVISD